MRHADVYRPIRPYLYVIVFGRQASGLVEMGVTGERHSSRSRVRDADYRRCLTQTKCDTQAAVVRFAMVKISCSADKFVAGKISCNSSTTSVSRSISMGEGHQAASRWKKDTAQHLARRSTSSTPYSAYHPCHSQTHQTTFPELFKHKD